MPKGYTLTIYPGKVTTVVGGFSRDAARRGAERTQERVKQNIQALGRVDTREMIDGIVIEELPGSSPLTPSFQVVGKAKHTKWQEDGTQGHTMPKGKVMRFKPKGSGKFVFARKVRGVTPGRFMRNAYNAIQVRDFLK